MSVDRGLGPSFEAVLARARTQDGAALTELYRAYAGRVRAFAQARGTDDAEALANDVMFRCFQNLDRFSGDESAFVRWIFTIARNRLIDLHRHRSRRPAIADEPVPDRVVRSAEAAAMERAGTEQAFAWLETLTVEQREVVALRLIDDLSIADVAAIVGRPVSAVKALQRRGLRRLERHISGEAVS